MSRVCPFKSFLKLGRHDSITEMLTVLDLPAFGTFLCEGKYKFTQLTNNYNNTLVRYLMNICCSSAGRVGYT